MADQESLAQVFTEHRTYLHAVAYRVLGSSSDAEDAVQETWLRLSRSDVTAVVSLRAWLTTVTGRVALTMLRARTARREEADADVPEDVLASSAVIADDKPVSGPEEAALHTDEVSAALQVMLDTLEPRERLAFVLHDLFTVPFDEIAPVVGTTSAAARQLASRARRRVRAASPPAVAARLAERQRRQRAVVAAFFAAAREARFAALLEILDPDVVLRADAAAARLGADESTTGAEAVARWLAPRARGAVTATVAGEPGAAWVVNRVVRVAFGFTISDTGRITAIDLIAEPSVLAGLDVTTEPEA